MGATKYFSTRYLRFFPFSFACVCVSVRVFLSAHVFKQQLKIIHIHFIWFSIHILHTLAQYSIYIILVFFFSWIHVRLCVCALKSRLRLLFYSNFVRVQHNQKRLQVDTQPRHTYIPMPNNERNASDALYRFFAENFAFFTKRWGILFFHKSSSRGQISSQFSPTFHFAMVRERVCGRVYSYNLVVAYHFVNNC